MNHHNSFSDSDTESSDSQSDSFLAFLEAEFESHKAGDCRLDKLSVELLNRVFRLLTPADLVNLSLCCNKTIAFGALLFNVFN